MRDMDTQTPKHHAFWQGRYEAADTPADLPWDLGTIAPPLQHYIDAHGQALGLGRTPAPTLASVGCGLGHDAAWCAQQGFSVTGFDFAPGAIEGATARYGELATFVQADIFDLPAQYHGVFDVVLEHTCFCAIPPNRRADYVQAVKQLIKPSGWFVGLIFSPDDPDGPPYPSSPEELRALFSPVLTIETLAPVPPEQSHPKRAGYEWLLVGSKL